MEDRTAYNLAIDSNQLDIARLVENKNFIRKYICMENEITEFKSSRNDISLLIILIVTILFKLIYIFTLEAIGQTISIDKVMTCVGI